MRCELLFLRRWQHWYQPLTMAAAAESTESPKAMED